MEQLTKTHETTFYVDNEPFTTPERELTVAAILRLSNNLPESDYYLIEFRGNSAQQERHDDPSAVIKVHSGQKFAAAFRGATPVSRRG